MKGRRAAKNADKKTKKSAASPKPGNPVGGSVTDPSASQRSSHSKDGGLAGDRSSSLEIPAKGGGSTSKRSVSTSFELVLALSLPFGATFGYKIGCQGAQRRPLVISTRRPKTQNFYQR